MRHFLVVRTPRGLESVTVFYEDAPALQAYQELEQTIGFKDVQQRECVLLGADSLKTAIATHGSWFDVGGLDELGQLVSYLAAQPGTYTHEQEEGLA